MAGDISLRVVTPVRLVLEERVDELTAPGPLGQLGILPDHAALMTTGGYAEVLDNVVTVLADAAEFPDEIDSGRAENARTRAERALEETDPTDEEALAAASAALQRALVRLETATRR